MAESWSYYTDDFDFDDENRMTSLLPSSVREVLTDPSQTIEQQPQSKEDPIELRPQSLPTISLPKSSSAPPKDIIKYYRINFHPKRTQICSLTGNLDVKPNDYVVTEADRGYDMGVILNESTKAEAHDQKMIHKIIRLATKEEVDVLPERRQREERSITLCQSIVEEQRLNMRIIDAELQFDGTQLTFYYITNHYIDFRSLIRVLFRTFGIRIWMWYDGKVPLKNIFNQNDNKKKIQNKKEKKNALKQ
ncbi:polymerase suppressor [Tritrichomonas musculus]|uniref:Polymerase suppressor n=1 Tax=Tritrichomonas musculus TaxID=1915356 RepID=A0ABR2JU95_9EUKA